MIKWFKQKKEIERLKQSLKNSDDIIQYFLDLNLEKNKKMEAMFEYVSNHPYRRFVSVGNQYNGKDIAEIDVEYFQKLYYGIETNSKPWEKKDDN